MPLLGGTVLVWFLYWLSMYAFLFVFPGGDDFMIGIGGTTLLLTLSAVSVAIPTPGGIGTYHYFISQTLILVFGITATRAIAFATISHFAPYLVVTVIGIFFTLAEGVSLKLSDVKKKSPDDGALGS